MPWPELGEGVEVEGDLALGDLWDRFEVFEALHHTLTICNPMSSEQLDETIDALQLSSSDRVLDAGCGYGELLIRAAEAADVSGIGVDLSPWMLTTAADRMNQRAHDAEIRWILGEAQHFVPVAPADVAVCIGAEWVWHDINGTIRALGERIAPEGRVVVGGGRRHHAATQHQVEQRGRIESIEEVEAMFIKQGFSIHHRIDPDDAGWDAYLADTKHAAQAWASQHPGPRADRWIEEQADWQAARERDREIIGWSLWIASR